MWIVYKNNIRAQLWSPSALLSAGGSPFQQQQFQATPSRTETTSQQGSLPLFSGAAPGHEMK